MNRFHRLHWGALVLLIVAGPGSAIALERVTLPPSPQGHYGGPYYPAEAFKDGVIVALRGVMRMDGPGIVTTLPPGMRPAERGVFFQPKGNYAVRVDIRPDGVVVAEGIVGSWVSLDGIAFSVRVGDRLPARPGYPAAGGGLPPPTAYLHDELVVLSGVVRGGATGLVTQLPARMRPKHRLVFNVAGFQNDTALNQHANGTRIDVRPDGSVRVNRVGLALGAKARISLSGIVFATRAGTHVTPLQGASHQGGEWGPAEVVRVGDLAVLSGMLNNAQSGPLLRLNRDLGLTKDLILGGMAAPDRHVRFDLNAAGQLTASAAGSPWVSLSGQVLPVTVPKAVPAVALRPLPLATGTSDWSGYQRASYVQHGRWITLGGLVRLSQAGHIATLPAGYRPRARQVFQVLGGDATARVDVTPDGLVTVVHSAANWVSLDGIRFSLDAGAAIPLSSPFSNYDQGFGPAAYRREGTRVTFSGLVSLNGAGHGARLGRVPVGARPAKRLVFFTSGHGLGARVDVRPDGWIEYMQGATAGYLSLAGIQFDTGGGNPLPLNAPWSNYDAGYEPATLVVDGDRVRIRGLVKSGSAPSEIARLPAYARPAGVRTFNLNGNQEPARVQIDQHGLVKLVGGGVNGGWLSLSGMDFSRGAVRGGSVAAAPTPTSDLPQKARDRLGSVPILGDLWAALDIAHATARDGYFEQSVRWKNFVVTVVLYVPSGKTWPNVAVLTEKVQLSMFFPPASGTLMDDLQLTKGAFIYVPADNAGSVAVQSLPEKVRANVSAVRTGNIDLVASANVFGKLSVQNDEISGALDDLGVCDGQRSENCLNSFLVHGANGSINGATKKFLRVVHPGEWHSPFRLKGVKLRDATLEYEKLGNRALARGWGTMHVPRPRTGSHKSYFFFGQCTLKKCKAENAFALNSGSASLEDVKDAASVLVDSTFGDGNTLDQAGLDQIPLHRVEIRNPAYREALNTVDGNPNFGVPMLLVTASTNQQVLPYTGEDESARGPLLRATGEVHTFGLEVGRYAVAAQKREGRVELAADITLGSVGIGGVGIDNTHLRLRREKDAYALVFSGGASLPGVGGIDLDVAVSNDGFRYKVPAKCPLRPAGLTASLRTDLGGRAPRALGDGHFTADVDVEVGCYAELFAEAARYAQSAFSYGQNGVKFVSELFVAYGVDGAMILALGGADYAGEGLSRVKQVVHEVLDAADTTFVFGNAAFGKAADHAGQKASDALGGGYTAGQTLYSGATGGAGAAGNFLGGLVRSAGLSGNEWKPTRLQVARPVECDTARTMIERGSTRTNLANRVGVEVSASGRTRQGHYAHDCTEIVVQQRPNYRGAWWRLDLGAEVPHHIAAVHISNAGRGSDVGGLKHAYVMLSNHENVHNALAERPLQRITVSSRRGGVRLGRSTYSRVHRLHAQAHHVVAPAAPCMRSGGTPLTTSRYVWIYQPGTAELSLKRVFVNGFAVTAQNVRQRCLDTR